ncbi:MAG: BlaI/MecI/CopY family transcriptional regulator [Verrucomicrobiota bacterium]
MSNESASEPSFSRRERQMMDAIYSRGSASAREIWESLPDAPTYATVRTLLRVLVEKGHISFEKVGRSYIYKPVRPREEEATSAAQRLLKTFYGGSVEQAVSGLIGIEDQHLDLAELERIEQLIAKAKKKAKSS